LDVPNGVSRQYFDALITNINGETQRKQLGDDGLSSPLTNANTPASIRMLFPVYNIISEPVKLDPSSGYSVRFRFEPNDLGKVAFKGTPLRSSTESFCSTGMVGRSGSNVPGLRHIN
jgi:hypothetical protein